MRGAFKKVEGENWAAALGLGVGARPTGEGKERTGLGYWRGEKGDWAAALGRVGSWGELG